MTRPVPAPPAQSGLLSSAGDTVALLSYLQSLEVCYLVYPVSCHCACTQTSFWTVSFFFSHILPLASRSGSFNSILHSRKLSLMLPKSSFHLLSPLQFVSSYMIASVILYHSDFFIFVFYKNLTTLSSTSVCHFCIFTM